MPFLRRSSFKNPSYIYHCLTSPGHCQLMKETMPAKYDPNDPKMYPNPSFGLSIWGPLVPASDCKKCIYSLCGLQIAGGLYLFWKPGRGPTVAGSTRTWPRRLLRTGAILSGMYLMGLAGLELVRLQLRKDPWAEDAKVARMRAVKAGKAPNFWLGPTGYQAIDYSEWRRRVEADLKRAEIVGSRVEATKNVYSELREKNRETANHVLQELQKENESKFQSGVTEHLTPDPEWDILEPWERLSEETDIVVRLVIHSRVEAAADPKSGTGTGLADSSSSSSSGSPVQHET